MTPCALHGRYCLFGDVLLESIPREVPSLLPSHHQQPVELGDSFENGDLGQWGTYARELSSPHLMLVAF